MTPDHSDAERAHDYPHAVTPEAKWSESHYFTMVDAEHDLAVLVRVAVKPNEGQMEATVMVYLPGGQVAFSHKTRPQVGHTDDLTVEGVTLQRLAPLGAWRLRFTGPALVLPQPHRLPQVGFAGARPATVDFDLTFTGTGRAVHCPVLAALLLRTRQFPGCADLVYGHFEQLGVATGTVTVDGAATPFVGHGVRDKSWGIRDWQAPEFWRWFTASFGPDLGLGLLRVGSFGETFAGGWIHRDGKTLLVARFDLRTTLAGDGMTHTGVVLDLVDVDGGTHHLEGDVPYVLALPLNAPGKTVVLNEGITRWRWGDRVGAGISEYHHHVDATGKPLFAVDARS